MQNFNVFKALNVTDTQKFAYRLAKHLKSGDIITLEGNLGAGKTTFAQGLAKGLGITEIVNSPTFTIIKEYNGERYTLNHMDVYRLEHGFEDIDFDEYFYGEGITVIEWPAIIKEIIPENHLNIKFEIIDEELRNIILEPNGERYRLICREFKENENFSD